MISRILLAALAASCCGVVSAQPLHPAVYMRLSASIVRVEADLDEGRLSIGSGVTVAPAVIATNCHVVRDAVSIRVAGAGAAWNVDAETADPHHDVCFLRVPGWAGRPVAIAEAGAPAIGAPVVAMGFTGGTTLKPRVGNVRALHEFEGARVIEADAPFNSGSSGGALFDGEGVLVGLLAFRLRNSTTSFYALPVDWIRNAMPRDEQWKSVKPLQGAAPFWEVDAPVFSMGTQ